MLMGFGMTRPGDGLGSTCASKKQIMLTRNLLLSLGFARLSNYDFLSLHLSLHLSLFLSLHTSRSLSLSLSLSRLFLSLFFIFLSLFLSPSICV